MSQYNQRRGLMRLPNIYYNYSPVSLHLLKVGGQIIFSTSLLLAETLSFPPHISGSLRNTDVGT